MEAGDIAHSSLRLQGIEEAHTVGADIFMCMCPQ